ncbi:uncharacterized protein LOC129229695 isoform X2 [Uloborus diversus]|uniref:uncharacterized protein LOC129229695 isoform X2 n=1 Tax=Uloborus diversus TaxID=327109 RepID=UPI00240A1D74|nr:uncharacterized protein LOC129229695 isoform X2 [Uloborus diversus]
MKKKKNKQFSNKAVEDASYGSTDEAACNFSDGSMVKDESVCEADCVLQLSKVSVCEDKKGYSKLIRSNWENVALLHPSIMNSLSITSHVVIASQESSTLCVVYPLKSLKKSTVCLPKDNFGFKQGDVVNIQQYKGQIRIAAEIFVSLNPKINATQDLVERVHTSLCHRFFSEGTSLKFQQLGSTYEITISRILPEIPNDSPSYSLNSHLSYLNDICSLSNLTLNDDSKYLQSTPHKMRTNFDQSFGVPEFSSTPQNNQLKKPQKTIPVACNSSFGDAEFRTDVEYFKISHKTKIHITPLTEEGENSSVTLFSEIIGLHEQLHFIKKFLNMFLRCQENHGVSLMFMGPSGTGKTMVMETISKEYQLHSERIHWYDIYSKHIFEAEEDLRSTFARAARKCPSIIFIDELNYLCPHKEEASASTSQICNILTDLIKELPSKVLIVSSSNSANYNDVAFKVDGRTIQEVKFPLPNIEERKAMFQKLLNEKKHSLTSDEIQDCAAISHTFSMKDITDVVMDAQNLCCMKAVKSSSNDEVNVSCVLNFSDIKRICKLKKPQILSSSTLKVKKVFWNDIGGMKAVKEKLRELVEWPLKYPEAFKRFNITPSKGVLMYGPPGCSKTMIAKALATECNLNFISRNTSDLFHKYVGESEKAVRELFMLARMKSPSIIFLDEIDALVAERGSCSSRSGVGDRIVTSLLTEIDGIEELHGVLIVAATNRPDMLDDALMRNGRINHFIYVPLPDKEARKEILKLQMKNRIITEEIDFECLSERTEGYTGAEIVNLCNEAALQLLSEDFEAESPAFTMKHFEQALNAIRPRTTKKMIDFYEKFNLKFCS